MPPRQPAVSGGHHPWPGPPPQLPFLLLLLLPLLLSVPRTAGGMAAAADKGGGGGDDGGGFLHPLTDLIRLSRPPPPKSARSVAPQPQPQPQQHPLSTTCLALTVPDWSSPSTLPSSSSSPPSSLPTPKLEDKMALSPVVLQARLVSRSSSYNGLYFASFKVLKVLKGTLPRKLRRHVRLVFRRPDPDDDDDDPASASASALDRRRRRRRNRRRGCDFPVPFSASTGPGRSPGGRKFALFVRRVDAARLVAVATPEPWDSKDTRRAARKILCPGCASAPTAELSRRSRRLSAAEGAALKIRCKVGGNPAPRVDWFKDGLPIGGFRTRIRNKRRRSTLRIRDLQGRDSGNYSCRATNALGQSSQFVSISVRYSAPDPSYSDCPISSFCLNGGTCLYYEFIGELVCRCRDGFAGQRCQFKKALIDLPYVQNEACGPYGHDIHFREVCAAWKRPPVTQMTKEEFQRWREVERQVAELRRRKEREEILRFRSGSSASSSSSPPSSPSSVSSSLPQLEALALKDDRRRHGAGGDHLENP